MGSWRLSVIRLFDAVLVEQQQRESAQLDVVGDPITLSVVDGTYIGLFEVRNTRSSYCNAW